MTTREKMTEQAKKLEKRIKTNKSLVLTKGADKRALRGRVLNGIWNQVDPIPAGKGISAAKDKKLLEKYVEDSRKIVKMADENKKTAKSIRVAQKRLIGKIKKDTAKIKKITAKVNAIKTYN